MMRPYHPCSQSMKELAEATKMWNDLPDNVVGAPSVKSFEKRLDKYWEVQEMKFDYKADFVYSANRGFDFNDDSE